MWVFVPMAWSSLWTRSMHRCSRLSGARLRPLGHDLSNTLTSLTRPEVGSKSYEQFRSPQIKFSNSCHCLSNHTGLILLHRGRRDEGEVAKVGKALRATRARFRAEGLEFGLHENLPQEVGSVLLGVRTGSLHKAEDVKTQRSPLSSASQVLFLEHLQTANTKNDSERDRPPRKKTGTLLTLTLTQAETNHVPICSLPSILLEIILVNIWKTTAHFSSMNGPLPKHHPD